jgi:hypothetical protein
VAGYEYLLPPNNPPTVEPVQSIVTPGEPYIISVDSIQGNYQDIDGDNIQRIRIESLPSNGTLQVSISGVITDVVVGQEIDIAELASLIYTPREEFAGEDSFSYRVYDGRDYSIEEGEYVIFVQASTTTQPEDVEEEIMEESEPMNDETSGTQEELAQTGVNYPVGIAVALVVIGSMGLFSKKERVRS